MENNINYNINPLVSIIIPVYNAEKYLPYLFDDLKKQTFKNFEAIFVNDCSTDNSLTLLNSFKEEMKDSTFTVVIINHQSNSGSPGLTRNTGIDVAKGKYICFADSDDGFKSEFLEILLHSIQNDDSDLGVVGFNFQYKKKMQKSQNKKVSKLSSYFFDDTINSFGDLAYFISFMTSPSKYGFMPCPVWNKIFKKELIGDIRFKNILAEDIMFVNEYILKCSKVGFVKRNLYNYFMDKNRGSLTTTYEDKIKFNLKFINDYVKVTQEVLKNYKIDSKEYNNTAGYFFGCLASALRGYYKFCKITRFKEKNSIYKEDFKKFSEYLNHLYKCYKKSNILYKWCYMGIYYKAEVLINRIDGIIY